MTPTKKKILILGTDQIWSLDKVYFNHLSKMDYLEVSFFASENIFHNFYHKSILNKLVFKLNLSTIYQKVFEETKKAIELFRPDIIWVFKGMSIIPDLLLWAKKKGIMLVNFNADHPFIFSSRGSGNANISKSIELYDLHLTYNLEVIDEIKKQYSLPTEHLPFGYEIPDQSNWDGITEEKNKVCFIGNPDDLRTQLLRELLNNDVEIDVFGNDWDKHLHHRNLTIHKPIYGNEILSTLKAYRIQLNIMRKHNLNSHNMRTFEVPGVGGIMLAPNTVEHQLFFENGKECFLYNDVAECILLIKHILGISFQESQLIRDNAKNRSMKSGYNYQERANQAIKFILQRYES